MICVLPWSLKLNSVGIIALLLLWLVEGEFKEKFQGLLREPFFILNALLFLLYLLSLFFSEDRITARFFIEKNLSLILIPLIFLSKRKFHLSEIHHLFKAFSGCILLMMLIATSMAIHQFVVDGDYHVFFYHALAHQVGISAIVASLLCCVSIAVLFALPEKGKLKNAVILLFCIWIIFLAAKLFLLVLALLLLVNVFVFLSRRLKIAAVGLFVAIVLVLTLTHNPLRNRFADMDHFSWTYLQKPVFDKADYFDGLSLRLLYVRFSLDIMTEQRQYVWGVGTGDAERLLKEKIIAHNMYTGDGITDKEGYLALSFHNEYLQKFVQLGIAGLTLFLAVIGYCFWLAVTRRNKLLLNLLLIFCLSFITDTLVETQLGLVSYLTFLCLAINLGRNNLFEKNKKQDHENEPAH
jgi:O-antigen ligase